MRINLTQEVHEDTLSGHLILESLTHELGHNKKLTQFLGEPENKDCYVDVKLLINDREFDLNHFVEHWESQVERMIKEEAQRLLNDKLSENEYLLQDLNPRIKEEIDKRLEDWERNPPKETEENYDDD